MSEAIQSEAIQSEAIQTEPVRSKPVHPVDEILPLPKLFALGLQHVLVMYANAVAVPLIIGGALHLPKDQMAMLINADLFACGIATLIQTVGFGPFGIRLPIIMGVTAVSISPMLAMAAMPGVGLTGICSMTVRNSGGVHVPASIFNANILPSHGA